MAYLTRIERRLLSWGIGVLTTASLAGCGSDARTPNVGVDACGPLDATTVEATGCRDGGSVQDAPSGQDATSAQDAPPGSDTTSDQDAGVDGGGARLPPLKTVTSASIIDCSGTVPFMGPLCKGSACTVVERTLLAQAQPAGEPILVSGPRLALGDDCRPHVVYAAASDRYANTTQYVTRKDGAWTSEMVANGTPTGIVVDPATQQPTVQLRSDDFANYDLWSKTTSWTTFGNIHSGSDASGTSTSLFAFRRDPAGKLHVVDLVGSSGIFRYGTFDGSSWTYQPLTWGVDDVQFGGSGVPNFFGGDQWGLLDQAAESIPSPTTVSGAMNVVADDDPSVSSGTPHLVFGSSSQPTELVHAARKPGAAGWTVTPVRWPVVNGFCPWDIDTTHPIGTTCPFDYETLGPYAIVTSGSGDVRILYTRLHAAGTAVWRCGGLANCSWQSEDGTVSQSELWIASQRDDGSFGSEMLVNDFPTTYVGDAAVDALGRIHVVASLSETSIVYYVIAAAGAQ